MGQWYWISEYLRLMLAYGFVLYVWPAVVFEKHLAGKSLRYRFAFCVTVPLLLANTVILLLGLVHALRPWVVSTLFYCVFAWRLLRNHPPLRALAQDIKALHHETMTMRRLLLRAGQRARDGVRAWLAPVRARLRGRYAEFALLLVLLIFGTLYFSYGAFDEHSYGFGDEYVHHQWIQGLVEGKPFVKGIYPEGLHCMVYLTCMSFGIRLYSGVLFFAGVHVHIFLLSAWIFMREVFRGRYTPLAALALFLCLDQLCVNEVFGMSRLSWTLPLEYGLYAVFLSAACLIRFFRRVARGARVTLHPLRPKEWGIVHDPDVSLFGAAVAASLAVHFYVTIIAVFFCGVTALVFLRQLIRRGSILPLAVAAVLALALAVAPMGAACAAGYPLEKSLYWAIGVIEGNADEVEAANVAGDVTAAFRDREERDTAAEAESAEMAEGAPEYSLGQKLLWLARDKAETLYREGYATLYPGVRSRLILIATGFALCASLLGRVVLGLRDRHRRKTAGEDDPPPEITRDRFNGILVTALLSVVLMAMYNAEALGLPQLVAGSRLCSTEQMLLVMLYAVPLDFVLALPEGTRLRPLAGVLGWAAVLGVYALAQLGGFFHSYPYVELTRYNAATELSNRIMDTLPKQQYTVISTSDEIYQIIGSGFHEELLTFLQRESDPSYTIPTPYLLLYIEKHPIQYAQYHFASGPRWLAWEDYPRFYPAVGSQCPEILHGQISDADAKKPILYGAKLSDTAATLEGRTIMESRAWAWYQTFSAMHPRDCSIVYEDEDFLCCCITQNPASLYTLGVTARTEGGT